MEGNKQKISKFSSGLNIIMRLDTLWKRTHVNSSTGKYQAWNTDLDRMWLELARDLDKEDTDEFDKKKNEFDKYDEEIKKIGQIRDATGKGFKKNTETELEIRNKHYKKLMEKQLFIARLENQLGKGTTYDEGYDDDFE